MSMTGAAFLYIHTYVYTYIAIYITAPRFGSIQASISVGCIALQNGRGEGLHLQRERGQGLHLQRGRGKGLHFPRA